MIIITITYELQPPRMYLKKVMQGLEKEVVILFSRNQIFSTPSDISYQNAVLCISISININ